MANHFVKQRQGQIGGLPPHCQSGLAFSSLSLIQKVLSFTHVTETQIISCTQMCSCGLLREYETWCRGEDDLNCNEPASYTQGLSNQTVELKYCGDGEEQGQGTKTNCDS